jgi:hypothetical protein
MAAGKLVERRGRNATGLMDVHPMPAGLPVREIRRTVDTPHSPLFCILCCPLTKFNGYATAAENRIGRTTMNREHYLSKRSRAPLQRPADRRGGPEDNAEADIEPAQEVEPAESGVTSATDTAKQETPLGQ